MQKRPGKHLDQATDIIRNDKEMENLIQQLVKKAYDSGSCVTHLNKAISAVWQESFHVETKIKKFNKVEEDFSKKVERFLDYYENDFIKHNSKFPKREYLSFKKGDFYFLLCSMYGIFQTEDKITMKLIENYAKEHGLKKSYSYSFSRDICFLSDFLSCHLHFSQDNTIPTYSEKYVGCENSIASMDDYINFKQKYVLSNKQTCRTAIMAIWFIQKYF